MEHVHTYRTCACGLLVNEVPDVGLELAGNLLVVALLPELELDGVCLSEVFGRPAGPSAVFQVSYHSRQRFVGVAEARETQPEEGDNEWGSDGGVGNRMRDYPRTATEK